MPVEAKGYGSALMGGIAAARGEYVVMGDADDSYDFTSVPAFLAQLRQGFDLVMGNRFKGGIAPDAMPPLHKYLGNPVLDSHRPALLQVAVRRFSLRAPGLSQGSLREDGVCVRQEWNLPRR